MNEIFSSMKVSASGLAAERKRMEVVASNIANAQATMTDDGGPYRRQQVLFQTALKESSGLATNSNALNGVTVEGIVADQSEFQKVFQPGHPHADEQGFVEMPNVKIPMEMIDLIAASRSYEANLKAMTMFKEMAEQSLSVLRGQ